MNLVVFCVLILLFVFLFVFFMIVKLDLIKIFFYKESFVVLEVKVFCKVCDLVNKKKFIFVSESFSFVCNLFFL